MECKICNKQFEQKHFNQKCCSVDCKKKARSISVRKYKDSKKGKESLNRWYESDARNDCEKRYRSKPETKALQVKRTTRYYNRHPDKKKQNEKSYSYRRRGYNAGYIDWKAVKKLPDVCVECGSTEDMTIDHIKPLSKGGDNHISNLQKMCRKCNASKGCRYDS